MPSSPAGESGTILVVDDHALFLSMTGRILRGHGYTVITAENGESGLGQARSARPDLIILDIEMPVMDGFAVCAALKKEPALRSVPVIFLTSTVDPKLNEKAFAAGGAATLLKGSSSDQILNTVRLVLAGRKKSAGDSPSKA